MTPFDVFRYHRTLYLHFTDQNFDFFKYRGKSKSITPEKYKKHPSKETYDALFRKYGSHQRVIDFFVANMVAGKIHHFPGEYLDDECHDQYLKWKGGIASLSYCFEQELRTSKQYLDNEEIPYSKLLEPEQGQHPLLLRYYYGGLVSLETVLICVIVLKLAPHWNKRILEDVMWPNTLFFIRKYRPFLKFDKEKMKETVRLVFKSD